MLLTDSQLVSWPRSPPCSHIKSLLIGSCSPAESPSRAPTCHQEKSHFLRLTYKALPHWSLINLPKFISHHEPPGIQRLFPLSPLFLPTPAHPSGVSLIAHFPQKPSLTPWAGSGAFLPVLTQPPLCPWDSSIRLYCFLIFFFFFFVSEVFKVARDRNSTRIGLS